MRLINNIDTIRIKVNSHNNIYYFPENNNLIGKVINNIYTIKGDTTDPYTGLRILEPQNTYITLHDTEGNIVLNQVELSFFLKNKVELIEINSVIDWQKSYIQVLNPNVSDEEIILFVTYDGVIAEDIEYDTKETITIPANHSGDFEDFIYSDMWGKLVKIDVLNREPKYPIWFNIKDKNGKNFSLIMSELFQDKIYSSRAVREISTPSVVSPLRFNYLSPIWKESKIINQNNYSANIILYFKK